MATTTDVAMMLRALALARHAARLGEVPVGAVVYETASGHVIADGFNRRQRAADPAAHAELLAIRRAAARLGRWRLSDLSLAVTLEPCPMCAGLLVNARLGRLVYAAPDPKAGAIDTLMRIASDPRLNHRLECLGGVLADEAARLLSTFFAALRRTSAPED